MTTETALPATTDGERTRKLALLKAIGLDRLPSEQRELAIAIANKYELDLLLKHLVLIEGRAYITRDGLLHIAHRSGQLDGITVTEPETVGEFWRSTCSVFRKDMSHPFTYSGRYPTKGGNQKFAPEMAVKVGEVMALRRAFDVSMPTVEERWDVDVPDEPAPPAPTLAERVQEKAAAVRAPEPEAVAVYDGEAETARLNAAEIGLCLAENAELMTGKCEKDAGHKGAHRNATGSWPA